jgi:hypothetical protein
MGCGNWDPGMVHQWNSAYKHVHCEHSYNSHKISQEETNNFLSPLLHFTNDLAHTCTEQCCIIQYTLLVMSK